MDGNTVQQLADVLRGLLVVRVGQGLLSQGEWSKANCIKTIITLYIMATTPMLTFSNLPLNMFHQFLLKPLSNNSQSIRQFNLRNLPWEVQILVRL